MAILTENGDMAVLWEMGFMAIFRKGLHEYNLGMWRH